MHVHPDLLSIQRKFLDVFEPPNRQAIVPWVEEHIRLSDRSSAIPGPIKLWEYQKGLLNAMADRNIAFVTVIKASRVGYTKSIMSFLGNYAANRPASMALLLPTVDDCRKASIFEISPLFDESPALRNLLYDPAPGPRRQGDPDNSTMVLKLFRGGGSLRILSARTPRNFRASDIKILLMDEIDAYTMTEEGDPVELCIKRTLSHDDRKVIMGSSPTIEGISLIQRRYDISDKRVFEVPCPFCHTKFEMLWEHLQWPHDLPLEAYLVCPSCGDPIDEEHKPAMINDGEWRVTVPEVKGHAGFRLNALISQFHNARWGMLAEEFLRARRGGPSLMQVFTNTVLGKVSKQSIDAVDERFLQAKAEDFDLNRIPEDVVLLTCGVDTQHQRLECCVLGFGSSGQIYILGYNILHGSTIEQPVWRELDRFLVTKFKHPHGYQLPIEATAVDSGGAGQGPESRTQAVYAFTDPRAYRRIFAIKSVAGPRPIWVQSFSKKKLANKLFLIGHDQVKTEVLERLSALPFIDEHGEPALQDSGNGRNPTSFRISNSLPESFFEQCASERRYISYVKNRPKVEFKLVQPGARNEALDCLVYAMAVRSSITYVNLQFRGSKRGDGKTVSSTVKPKRSLGDAFGSLNS